MRGYRHDSVVFQPRYPGLGPRRPARLCTLRNHTTPTAAEPSGLPPSRPPGAHGADHQRFAPSRPRCLGQIAINRQASHASQSRLRSPTPANFGPIRRWSPGLRYGDRRGTQSSDARCSMHVWRCRELGCPLLHQDRCRAGVHARRAAAGHTAVDPGLQQQATDASPGTDVCYHLHPL